MDITEIDAVAMDDGVQISVNRHKRLIAESELKTNNLTKDELIAIVRKIANKEAQLHRITI